MARFEATRRYELCAQHRSGWLDWSNLGLTSLPPNWALPEGLTGGFNVSGNALECSGVAVGALTSGSTPSQQLPDYDLGPLSFTAAEVEAFLREHRVSVMVDASDESGKFEAMLSNGREILSQVAEGDAAVRRWIELHFPDMDLGFLALFRSGDEGGADKVLALRALAGQMEPYSKIGTLFDAIALLARFAECGKSLLSPLLRVLEMVRGDDSLFLQAVVQLWQVRAHLVGTRIEPWDVVAVESFSSTHARTAMAVWLEQMMVTADARSARSAPVLAARMGRLLDTLCQDPDLLRACEAVAFEATNSCADRAALGLARMEQAALCRQARREGLSLPSVLDLGRVLFRGCMLEKMANKFARIHDVPDPIELHLALQVRLRERLSLPFAPDQMHFDVPELNKLRPSDVDDIGEHIESLEHEPVAPFLNRLPTARSVEEWGVVLLKNAPRHTLAAFVAQDFAPWAQMLAHQRPTFAAEHQACSDQMYQCLDWLDHALHDGHITEQQYRSACDQAMFFAQHGAAYRLALETLHSTL